LAALTGQGCEQRQAFQKGSAKDELGTVIFAVPNVPGSDKRVPTPELDNPEPPQDEKGPSK
jgi:hypothetical protein